MMSTATRTVEFAEVFQSFQLNWSYGEDSN